MSAATPLLVRSFKAGAHVHGIDPASRLRRGAREHGRRVVADPFEIDARRAAGAPKAHGVVRRFADRSEGPAS
jgi:hypothetical protein